MSEVVPSFIGIVVSPQHRLEYEIGNYVLHRCSSWSRAVRILAWVRRVFLVRIGHLEGKLEPSFRWLFLLTEKVEHCFKYCVRTIEQVDFHH